MFLLEIGEDDVAKLLKDSGVSADAADLKVMMSKLSGKSVPELIAEGQSQMATLSAPSAGGAVAASADAAPAEAPAEKKEEKEEEEEEIDMGGMFGDDDY